MFIGLSLALTQGHRPIDVVVAPTVPAAPTLSVAPGSGQNVLTFADGANGGAAITGHKLYRGTASGAESLLGTVTTGSPYTDTGLTNGTTYFYRISAVNSVGEGALSAEASATPVSATPPDTFDSTTGFRFDSTTFPTFDRNL